MKALRFDGTVRLEDVDVPRPGPGEALLRVRCAGICSTDLHIVQGYMGFRGTLGHELVGEVVESADPGWRGRRVAGEINLACGTCDRCARGLGRHCPTRTVLGILNKDGCFAEYVTLPIANLHPIDDALSDELAVFAEPLAAAFEILQQIHVEPDARVCVLGDGKLGALVAMVLLEAGVDLMLVGHHPAKLARIAALGARTQLAEEDLAGAFDLVVEATGSASGFDRARTLVRPRGTLVLKSTFHGKIAIDTAPIVIDELTIVGSRCGPFPPALRALTLGRIDPSPLIEAVMPLADGALAIERASQRGASKIILRAHG